MFDIKISTPDGVLASAPVSPNGLLALRDSLVVGLDGVQNDEDYAEVLRVIKAIDPHV